MTQRSQNSQGSAGTGAPPLRPLPVGLISGLVRGLTAVVRQAWLGAALAVVLMTLQSMLTPEHLGDLLLVLGAVLILAPAGFIIWLCCAAVELVLLRWLASRTAHQAAPPLKERHYLAKGAISRFRDGVLVIAAVSALLAISNAGLALFEDAQTVRGAIICAVIAAICALVAVPLTKIRSFEHRRWEATHLRWPKLLPPPSAHPLSLVDRSVEASLPRQILLWSILGVTGLHFVWWVLLAPSLRQERSASHLVLSIVLLAALVLLLLERTRAMLHDALRLREYTRDPAAAARARVDSGEAPSVERAAAQQMLRERHPMRALATGCAALAWATLLVTTATPLRALIVARTGSDLPWLRLVDLWRFAEPGPVLRSALALPENELLVVLGVLGVEGTDLEMLTHLAAWMTALAPALLGALAVMLHAAAFRALARHRIVLHQIWPDLDPVLAKKEIVRTDRERKTETSTYRTIYSRGTPPYDHKSFHHHASDLPR